MIKRTLSLFLICMTIVSSAFADEKVSFFQDMVSELDERVLKFLSGSTWLLEHEIIALPLNEGIVVFKGHDTMVNEKDFKKRIGNLPKKGVLFYEGNEVVVTLVNGFFIWDNGKLTTVEKAMGNGAILQTSDGSLWSIPNYDQYDTGYWLPPYKVIIHSNELYITNLKKGKKIWVSKVK